MTDAGLPLNPLWVLLGDYSRDYGRVAAAALFSEGNRPTAVLACSDYIAIGILQAARQMGLVIPQDLSLVGFDDSPFAELVDPALTTVRQPIGEMGRLAFSRLLALMTNGDAPPLTRLPVELIIRQSVRKLGEPSQ